MDKRDNKKRYQELKAAGICTQCKRNNAIKGRVKCGQCLYDDRAYRRAKKEMSTQKIVIEKKEYEELKENAIKYQQIVFRDKGDLEEKYVEMVKKEELEELKEKARKLDCLEAAGVDNWILYPDAMAELDPEEDDTNDFLDVLEEQGE